METNAETGREGAVNKIKCPYDVEQAMHLIDELKALKQTYKELFEKVSTDNVTLVTDVPAHIRHPLRDPAMPVPVARIALPSWAVQAISNAVTDRIAKVEDRLIDEWGLTDLATMFARK